MLRRTRRASTACLWCHHRKVRCDASILGCPCTRCRQDGRSDCVLRRKPPKQSKDLPSHIRSPLDISHDEGVSRNKPIRPDRSYHSTDFRDVHDESNATATETQSSQLGNYPFLFSDGLTSLAPEDLAFLGSKGSLSIPDRAYAKEFVTKYFLRIHPILPVLDEIQFWRAFEGDGTEKISLFVFQALLFASCPFVPLETLQRCGFADKRDARKKLYNRSKLLYDLMVETKLSARAQGALLLTHHTSAEAPQAGSLWLTRAIDNATLIDTKPAVTIENVSSPVKKRLWWSMLLRDRSLCIGLRRQPQIASHNLHGCRDWLKEEEFEQEMHGSPVYDYESKKALFVALQDQCRLAVLLTDLVSLIFTPRVTTAASYSRDAFRALMCTIEEIKKALLSWEVQALAPHNLDGRACRHDPSLTTKNLTFMYYHAARVDLAQYTALVIEEHLALTPNFYREAVLGIGKDLSAGIEGLTAVMEYFSRSGQVENLPLSVGIDVICSLGYVGMPLILAAIDLKLSPSYDETKIRQKRLNSLSRIIRLSESLYDVTDFVAAGANHILQLAYVTTQNFFLPSGPLPRTITVGEENHLTEKQEQNLTRLGKSTPVRAKSWLDAFFRYPRAYLLISTSVDYSLSVGRLPHETSLPALVRDIPAMGSIMRLPWAIDTSLTGGIPLYENRGGVSGPLPPQERSVGSRKGTPGDKKQAQETRTMHHDMTDKNTKIYEEKEWDENHAHINDLHQPRVGPVTHNLEESCGPMTSAVNLDFLDLEISLNGKKTMCYDSPVSSSDNFGSLPKETSGDNDTSAGRLARMEINSGLNAGFPSESLDPILFNTLFLGSSTGGYANV